MLSNASANMLLQAFADGRKSHIQFYPAFY